LEGAQKKDSALPHRPGPEKGNRNKKGGEGLAKEKTEHGPERGGGYTIFCSARVKKGLGPRKKREKEKKTRLI